MNRREFLISSSAAALALYLANNNVFASNGKKQPMKKSDFENFIFGVTIAAAQNEGAWNIDGRTPSIWDNHALKGNIKDNSKPDICTNFYHHYSEDIQLIKQIGFDNFRFSFSWSRILPDISGKVNPKGIDFYNRVIDTCLQNNINPTAMLYHWDLPQYLSEIGGWTNRDIVSHFERFSEVCTTHFGDRVKQWMVLNEPLGFTSLGYLLGMHAPGKRGMWNFLPAMHHAALCQSLGGRIVRQNVKECEVGTTFSCSPVEPLNQTQACLEAAHRMDAFVNRLFIEPSLGMGYPTKDLPFLSKLDKYIKPGDLELLPFDFDFIGIQSYFRIIAKPSLTPYLRASDHNKSKAESEKTAMNWEVYPEGIYKMIAQFSEYNVKKIYVTESGAAFDDIVSPNGIDDKKRIEYFEKYLEQVLRAKRDGLNVHGYFVWSLTDNWEWAEGYKPKFGLIHVDFETQQRTLKNSALWFKRLLQE